MRALFLAGLLFQAAPEPAPLLLPSTTAALGIDQAYEIRDGVLWTRNGAGAFVPFKGTGTVPGVTRPIVAVLADEVDHVAVITDDGVIHHHENGHWSSLWGLPQLGWLRAPMHLPFPLHELRAGRVAYSMRRDRVRFVEDRVGAQFHWGTVGTTSVYALTDDGARILLLDPWLPPDASREVCGPQRGGVRLASVAASASTVLVLAVDGTPYTGLFDYDVDGGTPFYHYAYGARAARAQRRRSRLGAQDARAARPGLAPGAAHSPRGARAHQPRHRRHADRRWQPRAAAARGRRRRDRQARRLGEDPR